jgi:hypothetical protein
LRICGRRAATPACYSAILNTLYILRLKEIRCKIFRLQRPIFFAYRVAQILALLSTFSFLGESFAGMTVAKIEAI